MSHDLDINAKLNLDTTQAQNELKKMTVNSSNALNQSTNVTFLSLNKLTGAFKILTKVVGGVGIGILGVVSFVKALNSAEKWLVALDYKLRDVNKQLQLNIAAEDKRITLLKSQVSYIEQLYGIQNTRNSAKEQAALMPFGIERDAAFARANVNEQGGRVIAENQRAGDAMRAQNQEAIDAARVALTEGLVKPLTAKFELFDANNQMMNVKVRRNETMLGAARDDGLITVNKTVFDEQAKQWQNVTQTLKFLNDADLFRQLEQLHQRSNTIVNARVADNNQQVNQAVNMHNFNINRDVQIKTIMQSLSNASWDIVYEQVMKNGALIQTNIQNATLGNLSASNAYGLRNQAAANAFNTNAYYRGTDPASSLQYNLSIAESQYLYGRDQRAIGFNNQRDAISMQRTNRDVALQQQYQMNLANAKLQPFTDPTGNREPFEVTKARLDQELRLALDSSRMREQTEMATLNNLEQQNKEYYDTLWQIQKENYDRYAEYVLRQTANRRAANELAIQSGSDVAITGINAMSDLRVQRFNNGGWLRRSDVLDANYSVYRAQANAQQAQRMQEMQAYEAMAGVTGAARRSVQADAMFKEQQAREDARHREQQAVLKAIEGNTGQIVTDLASAYKQQASSQWSRAAVWL